jgi:hypothetical protein
VTLEFRVIQGFKVIQELMVTLEAKVIQVQEIRAPMEILVILVIPELREIQV